MKEETKQKYLKKIDNLIIDYVTKDNIVVDVNVKEEKLVRTEQLNRLGLFSREIAKLVEIGKLERIRQGYYRIVDDVDEDSDAKLISLLYPDEVLCMTTALFYYGYSDRTPLTWDIAVDRNTSKARFNIDYPYVKPYYIDKAHLD